MLTAAAKHTVRLIAIVVLLILGVVGVFLPIIPGFVFFLAALALLTAAERRYVRIYAWRLRRRYPRWLGRFRIPGPKPKRRHPV